MVDEPISNFQCPSCGNMSIVNRIKYEQSSGWFNFIFNNGRLDIESNKFVCLKCNWEKSKYK
jgi:transcription elongation factor Elf1